MTVVSDDTALAAALDFTPDDLRANQQGTLSQRQRDSLRARQRRTLWTGAAAAFAVALTAAALLFYGRHGSAILGVLGIGVTLLNALLVGTFARAWLRAAADLRANQAASTQGEPTLTVRVMARRAALYVVRVGAFEAAVSPPVFEAFRARRRYTVYYAPHSGTLLSAQ